MGAWPSKSKWEAPSGDGLHLDFNETVLTESAAWAIAMAWSSSLTRSWSYDFPVRLATDSDPDNKSIVRSYAWVEFTCKRHRRVSTRRDLGRFATVAWFWLSCCAGYSGRENPRFWKRVFAELLLQPGNAGPTSEFMFEITDAIRFFDLPGCEFPRVHFDSQWISRMMCGAHPWLRNDSDDMKLTAIFKKLRPFLLPDRLERAVQVRVSERELDDIRAVPMTYPPPYEGDIGACWPKFEAVAESSNTITVPLPEDSASATANVRVLMGIQSSSTAEQKRYSEINLTRDLLGDGVLESVCSALPHAMNVKTVSLALPSPRYDGYTSNGPYESQVALEVSMPYPSFSRADWAWLGFAVFHPSTKTSSWRHLRISLDGITQECVSAMRLMSTGNNLHAVDGIGASTSTKYRTARLRGGAFVRVDATDSASVLVQLDNDSYVALCDDSTAVPGDWVRLIVPGVGLGWVQSSEISGIKVCDANGSVLKSLSIDFEYARTVTPEEVSAALDFVCLVGANLTYLDINSCGYLDDQTLRAVLLSCPRLQILHVNHDGSVWSHDDVDGLPHLKELCISPSTYRVDPTWIAERAKLKGFDEALRFSYSTLGLDPDEGIQGARHREVRCKRRVAFLSVIHAAEEDSVVAKLPSEVLKNIFGLVDGVQRELWVDPICTEAVFESPRKDSSVDYSFWSVLSGRSWLGN